ncbi:MAG: hypothetical protein OXU69_03365 [Gemmatimonadota bacterium]|nr:hypothetical protein [Gemmatimonadota bacterium]MDE2983721.1 hypothetical protein [Gemmatimonadota bacterium]
MADRVLIEMSFEGSRGFGGGGRQFQSPDPERSCVPGRRHLRMNRARPPRQEKEDEGGAGH